MIKMVIEKWFLAKMNKHKIMQFCREKRKSHETQKQWKIQ